MGKHESIWAVEFVPSMSHSGSDYIGQSSYAIHEDKKQFFSRITTFLMLFAESSFTRGISNLLAVDFKIFPCDVDSSQRVFTADSGIYWFVKSVTTYLRWLWATYLFQVCRLKRTTMVRTHTQMCSSHRFKRMRRWRAVWIISCRPLVVRWAGTCTAAVWSEPVSSWLLPALSPFSASPPGQQWS